MYSLITKGEFRSSADLIKVSLRRSYDNATCFVVAENKHFDCHIIRTGYPSSLNFCMTFLDKILCMKFTATSSLWEP